MSKETLNNTSISLTFVDPWLVDSSNSEYKLRILKDLGKSMDLVENEEGILEWTKVHKYKVEKSR